MIIHEQEIANEAAGILDKYPQERQTEIINLISKYFQLGFDAGVKAIIDSLKEDGLDVNIEIEESDSIQDQ